MDAKQFIQVMNMDYLKKEKEPMKQFDYAMVKDPEYFRDGRLDAHSDHVYYASEEEAVDRETSYRESLNGLWKFQYARNYESAIPGFEAEEYNCKDWEDIYVPAHIQMEGYDVPQYANVQYPWEGHEEINPGEIPTHFNPTASYVKYFTVPEQMQGKRLFISFQGAESGLALWLNGKFVGYSEDSFTPSEFELTEYVKEGENKLAAQVFKWTASSWCEDQDFYRFSGIYRDVYLYTVPEVHVNDLRIRAIPDVSLASADFELTTKTWGKGQLKIVLSKEGNVVLEDVKEISDEDTFSWKVDAPVLWSAEDPQLYDLELTVSDENGNVQEIIPQKVGFRRFEMKDGIMTLNGKRIVFKGVNRHEFSSVTGRHVSEEELRKDLTTMKLNNINAIRTCHYPDMSKIYELCDEYGLYMIDETNLESHGSWDVAEMTKDFTYTVPYNKPEWLGMMLDRANSMYQRDKNHPAILIWSCGNESFGGKDIFEMSQLFRSEDPTRLVHYEGVFHDRSYNDTSDMESQMYPSVEAIKEFLAKDNSKPFICCEYTHAMGNSCGAMHKYTDLTDTEPKYQGGFIWDFVDQSCHWKNKDGVNIYGYGGDFNKYDASDNNFNDNGLISPDRVPNPHAYEVAYFYQDIWTTPADLAKGEINIFNEYFFRDLSAYYMEWQLLANGEVVQTGIVSDLKVAPQQTVKVQIPFDVKNICPCKELLLNVSYKLKAAETLLPAGTTIAYDQLSIRDYKAPELKLENQQASNIPVIVPSILDNDRNYLIVKGENFSMDFNKHNGYLCRYDVNGMQMMEDGSALTPNFWRAPTDNDFGAGLQHKYAAWKNPELKLTSLKHAIENDQAVVRAEYDMKSIGGTLSLTYTINNKGAVKVTQKMVADKSKKVSEMFRFGMQMRMPVNFNEVEYYGRGPGENYADRNHGAMLGKYRQTVEEQFYPYIRPQETGTKTDIRWWRLLNISGNGLQFISDAPFSASALNYTIESLDDGDGKDQRHSPEVEKADFTNFCIDKAQAGLACVNSWGAIPLEKYRLPYQDYELSFIMTPVYHKIK